MIINSQSISYLFPIIMDKNIKLMFRINMLLHIFACEKKT